MVRWTLFVVGCVAVLGLAGCAVEQGDEYGTGSAELRGGRHCDSANRTYVSRDPTVCETLRFTCADGEAAFFDECGCGCETQCPVIALCVQGYHWDDTSCSCVPDHGGGQRCGDRRCGSGEVCCNASCGICTPPGGFCTQQACI